MAIPNRTKAARLFEAAVHVRVALSVLVLVVAGSVAAPPVSCIHVTPGYSLYVENRLERPVTVEVKTFSRGTWSPVWDRGEVAPGTDKLILLAIPEVGPKDVRYLVTIRAVDGGAVRVWEYNYSEQEIAALAPVVLVVE